MVGIHPNSPKNPHSAAASGGNDIDHVRTSPPENIHVLYGAMVGGPRPNDKYWDWRDDWVQNEVALDYNANIPALAAYQVCLRPCSVPKGTVLTSSSSTMHRTRTTSRYRQGRTRSRLDSHAMPRSSATMACLVARLRVSSWVWLWVFWRCYSSSSSCGSADGTGGDRWTHGHSS